MGNILAFTASSRQNGISTQLVQLAVQAARANGHDVQLIDLTNDGPAYCKGCRYCRTNDTCAIDDGFVQRIIACDGIILGAPIYFSGIAGQAKVWLDRLYPMVDRNFIPRHPGKKVLAIYVQGDSNEKAFLPAIRSTDYVFRMCGWKQLDSIICAGTSVEGYTIPDSISERVTAAAEKF